MPLRELSTLSGKNPYKKGLSSTRRERPSECVQINSESVRTWRSIRAASSGPKSW